ncbi:MAG: Amt family ammonium transporter [Acidimicrobiales bacterium]|jgi:ammonium transporter, Amt family
MEAGNVAWMITATAMVLFMVPGLALFYGGMLRSKNVLNMLMMNMYCLGAVTVGWVLIGHTLANTGNGGFIGTFDQVGMKDIKSADDIVSAIFLMTFAVITPALISGAVADRMKFSAWAVFVPVWSILVYCPVAFWMYRGWMAEWGVLDFAGGTTIHINAGAAALALVLVLGKRQGWPEEAMLPHNLVYVTLGAGILWFGWFGFNAGSAGAANEQAARAALNTFVGGAAGMLGWLVIERIRDGAATSLGAASGAIAGLAAVTPAAGFVGGLSPIIFGAISGVTCYSAIQLKSRFGYDDSLDVVGVHMVAGLVGGLLLGLLADRDAFTPGFGATFQEGALTGGGWSGGTLIWDQLVAMGAVLAFSFVMTLIIAKVIDVTIGLRVTSSAELRGLDLTQHAEAAYSS